MEYRDWFENSAARHEQINLTTQAVAWFIAKYPHEAIDITRAQTEWCVANGWPPDYLLLGKAGTIVTEKQATERLNFEYVVYCPNCGSAMTFDIPPQCPQVNPQKFTGLFTCSGENCMYHFYTFEGLIDIIHKIRTGRSDQLLKVAGVL